MAVPIGDDEELTRLNFREHWYAPYRPYSGKRPTDSLIQENVAHKSGDPLLKEKTVRNAAKTSFFLEKLTWTNPG